jgi:hypothetical protein
MESNEGKKEGRGSIMGYIASSLPSLNSYAEVRTPNITVNEKAL